MKHTPYVSFLALAVLSLLTLPLLVSAQTTISRPLSVGSRGSDVEWLQRMLSFDISLYPAQLVTGYFGRLTEGAVRLLQERIGLESVGIVGPRTRAFLNSVSSLDPVLFVAATQKAQKTGLAAPTSLTANVILGNSVSLSWNDTNTSESGYRIERSQNSSSGFVEIASVDANIVSYANSNLSPQTTYYYRVRAFKIGQRNTTYSSYSNLASATTGMAPDTLPPSIPTGVTAIPTSCSATIVTWNASTDTGGSGVQGYEVYRNSTLIATLFAPSTSLSDSGLLENTTYSYGVSAFDNAGNKSLSSDSISTSTATTPFCAPPPPPPPPPPTSTGGTLQWLSRLNNTGSGNLFVYGIKTDVNNNIFITGRFNNTVDFKGQTVTSVSQDGQHDIFLAKYTPNGTLIWVKALGGSSGEQAHDVAVDGAGDVYIGGHFSGTVDFGGVSHTSWNGGMAGDGFVAKYSGIDGSLVWVRKLSNTRVGTGGNPQVYDIATDDANNVYTTGIFNFDTDFGGVTLTANGTGLEYDIFVAKYSGSTGQLVWVKGFGNTRGDYSTGIVVDSRTGKVWFTGTFTSTINFGGSDLVASGSFYSDAFIAALSTSDGSHIWSKRAGASNNPDNGEAISLDSLGNVYAAGRFTSSSVDFGCGTLSNSSTPGNSDFFLVKLDQNGSCMWSKNFAGGNAESATDVVVDSQGGVAITGDVSGTYFGAVDFGGGTVGSNIPGTDGYPFIARYSVADGSYLWAKVFGKAGASGLGHGYSVTTDVSGHIIGAGDVEADIDFDGLVSIGVRTPVGGYLRDGYIVKFAP